MVRKLSASHVSQPAASRRDWGPVEAARYQFELLKLLSTDRRVEATARRMGLYGAEALPSRPRQPTKEKASSQGGSLDEAGTRKRRPRQLTAARKAKVISESRPDATLSANHVRVRGRRVCGQ